jgi:hypothetical protein
MDMLHAVQREKAKQHFDSVKDIDAEIDRHIQKTSNLVDIDQISTLDYGQRRSLEGGVACHDDPSSNRARSSSPLTESTVMRPNAPTTPYPANGSPTPRSGHRRSVATAAVRVLAPLLLLTGAFLATRTAKAGNITYNLASYPADQKGFTLTGSITTDGTIGTLSGTDILSWSVTIDSTTFTSSNPLSQIFVQGSNLQATANLLIFDPTHTVPRAEFALRVSDNTAIQWASQTTVFGHFESSNYLGFVNGSIDWDIPNPKMGGTNPWVIGTAVPEPSAALLAGLGAVSLVACALVRKRREQRRAAA